MSDLTPKGIAQDGQFKGQNVFLGRNDVAVDTAGNEIAFATPQGGTGILGITGLTHSLQGLTGASFFGATGLRGLTGPFGATGVRGAAGLTGFVGSLGQGFGITGLQGDTGIQAATGITGDTGIRGMVGAQGLTGIMSATDDPGATGIATNTFGITGIDGITGPEVPQGVTGLSNIGAIGLQGLTGLIGTTGLAGTAHIDTQTGTANTLATTIPANTLTRNNDQLDFSGIAFTADDANPTTFTLSLGSTTIINRLFGLLSDVCRISGTIIRIADTSQLIGVQMLFDSGATYAITASTSEDLTTDLTLTLTAASDGDGNGVTQLITTKINDLG